MLHIKLKKLFMKKAFYLFLVVLFVVSCQGPVGPEGPQGGTNTKIINLVASTGDWIETLDVNQLNRYYYCHFSMPEITSDIFMNGSVSTNIIIDAVQQPLPTVRHYQNTDGTSWTQTIDFDYSVGGMNVYVTNSNFADNPPLTLNFRVVIL